jgi:hypothetical protein
MTNYEWLIKKGILDKFLADYALAEADGEIYRFYNKYKIYTPYNVYDSNRNVASWLQSIRIEHKKYVLLDDVMRIMQEDGLAFIPVYKGKVNPAEVQDKCARYYRQKLNSILDLPTKEIEE